MANFSSSVFGRPRKFTRAVTLSKSSSCWVNVFSPDCQTWVLYNEGLQNPNQPSWFISQILSLEVDFVCNSPQICELTNENGIELLNPHSLLAGNVTYGNYRQFCEAYPKHAVAVFLASHFYTFRNISSVLAMGATATTGQAHTFGFVVAYGVVLQLCALLFGLNVMKNALQKSDSHILVYHKALVAADILLSLLSFLQTTHMMGIALLPVCFISKFVAAYFDRYMFDQLGIAMTLVEFVYLYATLLQAALSLDRALSVYLPMSYSKFASKRKAIAIVIGCGTVNSSLAGYIALSHRGSISGGLVYSTPDFVLRRYAILGSFFILYYALEFCCCSVTAAKVWRMKRNPVARHQITNFSILPCFLLLGTCGINMVGCMLEICFCFLFYSYVQGHPNAEIFGEFSFFRGYTDYRHCLLSLISSCGVGVHCLVSRQYRSEAAASIYRAYRRASSFMKLDGRVGLGHGQRRNSILPAKENRADLPGALVVEMVPVG